MLMTLGAEDKPLDAWSQVGRHIGMSAYHRSDGDTDPKAENEEAGAWEDAGHSSCRSELLAASDERRQTCFLTHTRTHTRTPTAGAADSSNEMHECL